MASFVFSIFVPSSHSPLFSRTVFLQMWSLDHLSKCGVVLFKCRFLLSTPPRFPTDSEPLGREQKYTCLVHLSRFLCTLRPENYYFKNSNHQHLLLRNKLQQFSSLILLQVYRWLWRTWHDADSGLAILVLRKKLHFDCTVSYTFCMDKSRSAKAKLCYLGSIS